MEQVNKGILEFYRENLPGAMRGSGSTLSCVYIRNDSAEAVNVGDSPIYLFRNGRFIGNIPELLGKKITDMRKRIFRNKTDML